MLARAHIVSLSTLYHFKLIAWSVQIYDRFIVIRNRCSANRFFVGITMISVAQNVTRIEVAALVASAIHAMHFIGHSLIKQTQPSSIEGRELAPLVSLLPVPVFAGREAIACLKAVLQAPVVC